MGVTPTIAAVPDTTAKPPRPPRVAIVNVYEDDNRGGAALTLAAVQVAKDLTSEHAEIFIVPVRASAGDAHRHVRATHDVTVLEPLIVPAAGRRGTLTALVASLLLVCGIPTRLPSARPATYHILRDADLVISRGGVVFAQRSRRLGDHARLWFAVLPAVIAGRFRRPLVFVGAQVGPVLTRTGALILRLATAGARVIWARGPRSARAAHRVAGRRTRVVQGPDSVFVLPPVDGTGCRQGVAVVVGGDQDLAGGAVPAIGTWLARPETGRVAVLQQVGGGDHSDCRWLDRLRSVVPAAADVEYMEADLGVDEYMRELAGVELVVSTRMHSVLLALLNATPAVAVIIGDAYRKLDVLEGIGLAELAADPADVASTAERARAIRPGQLTAHTASLRRRAHEIVAEMRDALEP